MSAQVAQQELASLSEFQRERHIAGGVGDEILSNNYRKFVKSTWYSCLPVRLESWANGEEINYPVNDDMHFLYYTYMKGKLPVIKVKKEYRGKVRVAWCHNVGTNIIKKASFKVDTKTYFVWDHHWADVYFQYFQQGGAGKREAHQEGIGSVRCLEEWAEELPAFPLMVKQPWFYSWDPYSAFPIIYKNSQSRVEHCYDFRLKISELLRVQLLEDGKWKNVTKGIHNLIDIKKGAALKVPELWGRYSYLMDDEVNWWKKCSDGGGKMTRSLYIRNVENCDALNAVTYNTISEVVLQSTHPCLAFFWMAENMTATKNRNYSNYTTNDEDLYSGWNPIAETTLKYDSTIRFKELTPDFSLMEAQEHFPSAPNERGYNAYSYAWDSTNFDGDVAIVLSSLKAQLQCKVADGDIYRSLQGEDNYFDEEEEEEEAPAVQVSTEVVTLSKGPAFKIKVRLLTLRKFTVSTEDGIGFRLHLSD